MKLCAQILILPLSFTAVLRGLIVLVREILYFRLSTLV